MKARVFKVCCYCWLIVHACLLYGQQASSLRFKRFKSEEGLSLSSVNCLLQDRQGYIWIGTQDGLNRFDGHSFLIFRNVQSKKNSIGGSHIAAMAEDQRGRIWVGTYGGGLNLYNPSTQSFRRYAIRDEEATNYTHADNVSELLVDRRGFLWIGTSGQGLFRLHTDSLANGDHAFQYWSSSAAQMGRSIENDQINVIFEDEKGNIWIGTDAGLAYFDGKQQQFRSAVYQHVVNELNHASVLSIAQAAGGRLWIGTASGLNLYDPNSGSCSSFPANVQDGSGTNNEIIYSLSVDRDGNLWVGTDGGGLNFYDSQEKRFTYYIDNVAKGQQSPAKVVACLLFDRDHNLWVGTGSLGVDMYSRRLFEFRHFQKNEKNPRFLAANRMHGMDQLSDQEVWIGTYGGGLHLFNRKSKNFRRFRHDKGQWGSLSSDNVWVVYADSQQTLWVGTHGGGLNKLSSDQETFTSYMHNSNIESSIGSNGIRSIYEDWSGNFWVGTDGAGLSLMNREKGTFKHYRYDPTDSSSISDNYVFHIYQTDSSFLWIGTNQGLNRLDIQTGKFEHFQHKEGDPHSISSNRIRNIYQDQKGRLWVGTSQGLNLFNEDDNRFTSWQVEDGLSNGAIYGILEDEKGQLWLSTNFGINVFKPEVGVVQKYYVEDGLQENEFNNYSYYEDQDGFMYLGGINGLTVFHPDSIDEGDSELPTVLTDFLYFNQPMGVAPDSLFRKETTALVEWEEKGELRKGLPKSISTLDTLMLTYEDKLFGFSFAALNYSFNRSQVYQYMLENYDDDWINTDQLHRRASYSQVPPGSYTFRVAALNSNGERGKPTAIHLVITPPWWMTSLAKVSMALLIICGLLGVYFYRVMRLKAQQLKLQQEVDRQTLELQNQKEEIRLQAEQLKSTNDQLVQLDEFKEQMMGMIVHDLKNPLNTILGYTQDRFLPQNQRKLEQSAKTMRNLVMNILELQKLEEAKTPLDRSNFTLGSCCKEAVQEVEILLEEKQLGIHYPSHGQVSIHADFSLISRVLTNLLSNAVKYSPAGAVITIASEVYQEKGFVKVSVVDQGEGIPEEKIHRLFKRFSQVDKRKSSRMQSTGLGLTFCKTAIEAHGMEIGVEGSEGRGAAFWFTLPLSEVENDVKAALLAGREEQEIRLNVGRELQVSAEMKAAVQPLLPEFESTPVYAVSRVQELLRKIPLASDDIEKWKQRVEETAFACNEESYQELLKLMRP